MSHNNNRLTAPMSGSGFFFSCLRFATTQLTALFFRVIAAEGEGGGKTSGNRTRISHRGLVCRDWAGESNLMETISGSCHRAPYGKNRVENINEEKATAGCGGLFSYLPQRFRITASISVKGQRRDSRKRKKGIAGICRRLQGRFFAAAAGELCSGADRNQ